MATYLAREAIYFSNTGRYVNQGEKFSSDLIPGLAWEPIDDDAKAAVEALNASAAPPAKAGKAAN